MTNHRATSTQPDTAFDAIQVGNGALTARILPYGATLQDLRLEGTPHALVLGHPTARDYVDSTAYFGAVVGRCANRIANGRYDLEGKTCHTPRNFLDRHTLHGGGNSIERMVWQVVSRTETEVSLHLHLPDGHEGFGGNLDLRLTYRILPPAVLSFELTATTDSASLCNIAPHWYFNLDGTGPICDHRLSVVARHYLPVDQELIPTGEIAPVAGTPFDFQTARAVGDVLYDHNFCLSDGPQPCREVARLTGPMSGITLTLSTTEPGLQVYSGAYLDETERSTLNGQPYTPFTGIALEPQGWPDAPNQPGFPSVVLRQGETYRHVSTFAFSRADG
ncbi:aldose epimerase family protein [Fluviibacterium sp. DFM31]|uniref:Aldose 1-epimerase n=1 Tax=Meridianimarinicoccus marinus TaxID=3231483 RepID=A0ABV3L9I3_9RHOB